MLQSQSLSMSPLNTISATSDVLLFPFSSEQLWSFLIKYLSYVPVGNKNSIVKERRVVVLFEQIFAAFICHSACCQSSRWLLEAHTTVKPQLRQCCRYRLSAPCFRSQTAQSSSSRKASNMGGAKNRERKRCKEMKTEKEKKSERKAGGKKAPVQSSSASSWKGRKPHTAGHSWTSILIFWSFYLF